MEKSENINELMAALSRAQGLFKNPTKDKTAKVPMKAGGQYEYKYADLAIVIDTVRDALAHNGLSVTQPLDFDTGGAFILTILSHSSGQFIGSKYPMPSGETYKPQEIGSYVTYLRRYCYCSILGIAADEDEDGALASGKAAPQKRQPEPSRQAAGPSPVKPRQPAITPGPVIPAQQNAPQVDPVTGAIQPGMAGFAERAHITKLAEQRKWPLSEVGSYIAYRYGGATMVNQLTLPEYQELAATISSSTPETARNFGG